MNNLTKNKTESQEQIPQLNNMFLQTEFVRNLILNGDEETLKQLGFNVELLPIMQQFSEYAPRILGTFSHPTELDVYKIVAAKRLIRLCLDAGIPPNLITVMQLDTRPINDSSERPLGIGLLGPSKDKDPLGILGNASEEEVIKLLMDQLEVQFTQLLKEKGISKNLKKDLKDDIKTKLLSKLKVLQSIKPSFSSKNEFQKIQSESLNFNRNLASLLLKETEMSDTVLEKIGTELLSESIQYRMFISGVVKKLIELKGIDFIKQLAADGKGLVQVVINNEILQLKVNSNNQFELMQGSKSKGIMPDEEFVNTLEFGLPLGKLESLVLTVCAQTIHYGSSHGEGLKSIQALGITGQAAEYLAGLQIGEDGTQGHDGLILGKKFVPLPLLLLLLSKDKVLGIIEGDEGVRFESIDDLKEFFAEDLITNSLCILNLEQ